MKEKNNLAEGDLCDWMNAYLREDIDAEIFANLVILDHFRTWDITPSLKTEILLAMSLMVSKKLFSPHDRKRVKELLKKAVETYAQSDKTDKTDELQPIIDEIVDISKADSK